MITRKIKGNVAVRSTKTAYENLSVGDGIGLSGDRKTIGNNPSIGIVAENTKAGRYFYYFPIGTITSVKTSGIINITSNPKLRYESGSGWVSSGIGEYTSFVVIDIVNKSLNPSSLPNGSEVEGIIVHNSALNTSGGNIYRAENDNADEILKGQPVYITASLKVDLARANNITTAEVIGLVSDISIDKDAIGNIQTDGLITIADWTSIIGSETLTAGKDYYLSTTTAGKLVDTAPSTPAEIVVYVGRAISTTTLKISIAKSTVVPAT